MTTAMDAPAQERATSKLMGDVNHITEQLATIYYELKDVKTELLGPSKLPNDDAVDAAQDLGLIGRLQERTDASIELIRVIQDIVTTLKTM